MKRPEEWVPTKYVRRKGRWIGSRDVCHLGPASRLTADLEVSQYQEFIPMFSKGTLVDLGCGNVPLYGIYKSYVDDVICVDWPNSLHPNRHLDVASDLNNPLPFRDATFETILLSSVLEHIAEPQQLWHELERIASPGGMVLLNVPFLYWVHEEPHDYYRYTEFALRRLAENAGFGIRLITPIGGALHVIADSCAKVLGSHGGRLGRGAPPVVQGLTAAISRTKFGKKFTAGTALNFPLGYFMVAEKPPAST